jgi:purine-binding chemotaxis protein CheW
MLVDAVSDIITLARADVQPPPDVMDTGDDSSIEGIAILDGRMVTLLSTSSLSAGLAA